MQHNIIIGMLDIWNALGGLRNYFANDSNARLQLHYRDGLVESGRVGYLNFVTCYLPTKI